MCQTLINESDGDNKINNIRDTLVVDAKRVKKDLVIKSLALNSNQFLSEQLFHKLNL